MTSDSLCQILLSFALLHLVLQGKTCLLLQLCLDFLLLHSHHIVPNDEKNISCLVLVLESLIVLHGTI